MSFKVSLRKIFSYILPRKAGSNVAKEIRVNKNLLKQEPDKFISEAEKFKHDPDVEAYNYIRSEEGQSAVARFRQIGKKVQEGIQES